MKVEGEIKLVGELGTARTGNTYFVLKLDKTEYTYFDKSREHCEAIRNTLVEGERITVNYTDSKTGKNPIITEFAGIMAHLESEEPVVDSEYTPEKEGTKVKKLGKGKTVWAVKDDKITFMNCLGHAYNIVSNPLFNKEKTTDSVIKEATVLFEAVKKISE